MVHNFSWNFNFTESEVKSIFYWFTVRLSKSHIKYLDFAKELYAQCLSLWIKKFVETAQLLISSTRHQLIITRERECIQVDFIYVLGENGDAYSQILENQIHQ